MNIALLEDNPNIRDLIIATLELAGHTVTSYTYGVSLLETLGAANTTHTLSSLYDMLIVDLGLPGELSGVDVITRLHMQGLSRIPYIVVVSGAGQQELDVVHKQYPTIPILRKPFNIKALVTLVTKQTSNSAYT